MTYRWAFSLLSQKEVTPGENSTTAATANRRVAAALPAKIADIFLLCAKFRIHWIGRMGEKVSPA